jgi:hypothetical protein
MAQMRQDVNVAVIHRGPNTLVTVSYGAFTTTEQTFTVPDRHLTVAEALALVAVEMRMNGVPEAVTRAQPYRRD